MLSTREFLDQCAGTWEGDFRLWFDPSTEPDASSPSRATITSELRGRTALLRYSWAFGDDEHEGLALLGRSDDGTFRMAWTETFGYAGNIMDCSSTSDAPDVLGHYDADGQRWGWRTTFAMPTPNELIITAYNVSPNGDESVATIARYRRTVA